MLEEIANDRADGESSDRVSAIGGSLICARVRELDGPHCPPRMMWSTACRPSITAEHAGRAILTSQVVIYGRPLK